MTGTSNPVSTSTGAPQQVTPTSKAPVSPAVRSILKARATTTVLKAQEGKTTFSVSFRVSAGQADSTFNLAAKHRELLSKIAEIATGEVYYLPTNETSDPKPKSFCSLDDFPSTDPEHRAFFHRKETKSRSTKQIIITVTHCTISDTSILTIKKKLIPYLQIHNLWIDGDDLKGEQTVVVGWLSGAHPDMTHKVSVTARLNNALSELTLTEEEQEELDKVGGVGALIPEVFATKRLMQFGNGDSRVGSDVVALCCVQKFRKLIGSLIVRIPFTVLGYHIVPYGFHLAASPAEYRELLMHNNDVTLKLRGLTVVNFHPSIWDMSTSGLKYNGTMSEYFMSSSLVENIEATDSSSRTGRYIFIVKDDNFNALQQELTKFFREQFPSFLGQEYLTHYGRYPSLAFSASLTKDMESKVTTLRKMLKDSSTSSRPSGPAATTEDNAWNRRPKLVFDFSSVSHPDGGPADSTAVISSGHSVVSGTPSGTHPSTYDGPSVSGLSTTGQSVPKSIASGDLSTVVSMLDTVVSRQEEANKRMIDFMGKQTEMMTALISHVMGPPPTQPFGSPVPRDLTPAKRPANVHSPKPSADTAMDEAPVVPDNPKK